MYSWPGARPGSNVWNGLYYTVRSNVHGDANLLPPNADMSVSVQSADSVCIVATAPLTLEEGAWIELQPGELLVLDDGIPHGARFVSRGTARTRLEQRGKSAQPPAPRGRYAKVSVSTPAFCGEWHISGTPTPVGRVRCSFLHTATRVALARDNRTIQNERLLQYNANWRGNNKE